MGRSTAPTAGRLLLVPLLLGAPVLGVNAATSVARRPLHASAVRRAPWAAPRPGLTLRSRARGGLARCALDGADEAADATPSPAEGDEVPVGPRGVQFHVLKQQFALFSRMAKPYFREDPDARKQLVAVLALTLLNSGISVVFSFVGRDFWTALSAKDAEHFYQLMLRFAGALAIGTPISVQYKFQRAQLALSWRQWLTGRLSEVYLADRNYYALDLRGGVDNPDQRLTDDVKFFTRVSLDFFIELLTSAIDLVNFSIILYGIYPPLFAAIVAYAAVGSVVTVVLGKSLVGLNFAQLQREADLRYLLVRLRENAESIAFFRGERQEALGTRKALDAAVANARALLGTQRRLEFFTVGYRYLIQILPILVVAPLYFKGSIELGVISQSVGAFNHILSDLSIIVNEIESLSAFSAGIERLGQLVEELEWEGAGANATDAVAFEPASGADLAPAAPPPRAPPGLLPAGGHELLRLADVTVSTPDAAARMLTAGLSLCVREGEHVLITGGSGCGKSSLLRVLAGLWSVRAGEVAWRPDLLSHEPPAAEHAAHAHTDTPDAGVGDGAPVAPEPGRLLFLPQRPYCTVGSLREQLLYPTTAAEAAEEWSSERLREVLEKVALSPLLERAGAAHEALADPLDYVCDWSDILSLGEQQRLGFARVLTNRPSLVLLDESTSALDLATEARMYALLEAAEGVTYISVGHRPSLRRFHRQGLALGAGGHAPKLVPLAEAGTDDAHAASDFEAAGAEAAARAA